MCLISLPDEYELTGSDSVKNEILTFATEKLNTHP